MRFQGNNCDFALSTIPPCASTSTDPSNVNWTTFSAVVVLFITLGNKDTTRKLFIRTLDRILRNSAVFETFTSGSAAILCYVGTVDRPFFTLHQMVFSVCLVLLFIHPGFVPLLSDLTLHSFACAVISAWF